MFMCKKEKELSPKKLAEIREIIRVRLSLENIMAMKDRMTPEEKRESERRRKSDGFTAEQLKTRFG